MTEPNVVEYYVSNDRMDTIRCHRWERTGDGVLHSTIRKWNWNYRTQNYTERRNTVTFNITPDGIVEYDGRPLEEYARSRVDVLTDKRFPANADVTKVRTR